MVPSPGADAVVTSADAADADVGDADGADAVAESAGEDGAAADLLGLELPHPAASIKIAKPAVATPQVLITLSRILFALF